MFKKREPATPPAGGEGFTRVAKLKDIKSGQLRDFQVGKIKVVLANVAGQIYAFYPWCPHQQWPLWTGDLKGELVRCYLHRWQFNVRTGENVAPGGVPVCLPTYPVKIIGDEIWVDLSTAKPV